MECSINQNSKSLNKFCMIRGLGRMSITHLLISIWSSAPIPYHRNSSKKHAQKSRLFKKIFKYFNPVLKDKKCQHIINFIHLTRRVLWHSNINKIKCSWLISGAHGVNLAGTSCNRTNKCWQRMRINGKIKSELLLSVLTSRRTKLLSVLIPKDGTKSST